MFDPNQSTYKKLRELIKGAQPRLVFWTGAGLSMAAGLPSWAGLIDGLVKRVKEQRHLVSPDKAATVDSVIGLASSHSNLWMGMGLVCDLFGPATFNQWVAEELRPREGLGVPRSYEQLWKLRPVGVVSFNLDRLVTEAFRTAAPTKRLPVEFSGTSAGGHLHLLTSPHPWVAQVHGTLADRSTWILTREQLNNLWRNTSYARFIEQVMLSHTVVFLGISAEDVSAGGHLLKLRELGADFGSHYWVTPRTDEPAMSFAREAGVQVVQYAADRSHSGLLDCLNDLVQYVPLEVRAGPVIPPRGLEVGSPLPPPDELDYRHADLLRQALNDEAARILRPANDAAYLEYADFRSKYARAIHAAWFLRVQEPDNRLLGHKLTRKIARGAFGDVYEGVDPTGSRVAIKVFREDQSNVKGMLESFRRGVRAMRILSDQKVHGIVEYRLACEIPPAVVMDFIAGMNLREARQARILEEWTEILRVGVDLGRIVYAAHTTAEVLHRDVRPANVMLRDTAAGTPSEVVVLDFDLSWHRDAMESSIDTAEAQSGYLAPELVPRSRPRGANSRSPLVDSYGLGMTLLNMRTGQDPVFLQHRHEDWETQVTRWMLSHRCPKWRSVPHRFARLVVACTRDDQTLRPTMQEILLEMERMMAAINMPPEVRHADMLAEELGLRASSGEITWNESTATATIPLQQGARLNIHGDEAHGSIRVFLGWQETGSSDRRSLPGWIKSRVERVRSRLQAGGWRLDEVVEGRAEFAMSAWLDCQRVRLELDAQAKLVSDCAAALGHG